jgi:hypothetical protein
VSGAARASRTGSKRGELVIRGAQQRLRELEAERDEEARRHELRVQLIEQLHTGEGLDADAAHEVRARGSIG